jgi:hypothetical protein
MIADKRDRVEPEDSGIYIGIVGHRSSRRLFANSLHRRLAVLRTMALKSRGQMRRSTIRDPVFDVAFTAQGAIDSSIDNGGLLEAATWTSLFTDAMSACDLVPGSWHQSPRLVERYL